MSWFNAMCRSRRLWLTLMIPMLCFPPVTVVGQPPQIPRTVEELWSDFDPRKEPLDARLVREWEKYGIVFRYVTYHIGTFKGVRARMAAFYGFPKGGQKVPGLLHLHGGGQRAFLHEVEFYAKQGYACLSINWGGREMESASPATQTRIGVQLIRHSRTCLATSTSSPVQSTSILANRPGTTTGIC